MRRRASSLAGRVLFAPLAVALAHCAGIVGIGDIPSGDAGGGVLPHHDGSVIFPGHDGGLFDDVFVPGHDGSSPGVDRSQPGTDSSQPGFDSPPPTGDAGALGYHASNLGGMTFDPTVTGPLTLASDNCQIYTDWPDPPGIECDSGNYQPQDIFSVNLPGGAGKAVIWVFTYISIDDMSSLNVSGPNPLILVALGSVDIAGEIDVSADRYDYNVPAIPGARLTGAGVGGYNNGGPQGGGGASFCGTGGAGATGTGFVAKDSAPGAPYGTASLIPLWGGSAGGGASITQSDEVNGNGGGAIRISASMNITIEAGGYITANGSGGVSPGDESGTGGGSGGAILLEAPTVTVKGILEANGGEGSDPNNDGAAAPNDGGAAAAPSDEGGRGSHGTTLNGGAGQKATGAGGEEMGYGGGGGGAGWIRINSTHAILSAGTITPAVGTQCATQGTLP